MIYTTIKIPAKKLSLLPYLYNTQVLLRSQLKCFTASTKSRAFVSGGGKKPWRQKGTGNARAGSIRSPLWVGGGTIFGPTPHISIKKINKIDLKRSFVSLFLLLVKNLVFFDNIKTYKNLVNYRKQNFKIKFHKKFINKILLLTNSEIFISKLFYHLLKTTLKKVTTIF